MPKSVMVVKRALTRRVLLSVLVLISGGVVRAEDLVVNEQMPGLALSHDFPAAKLRGYGTVAGKDFTDASGGSLLQITCQDAERARLLQAKYLSDLEELPPGTQASQIQAGGAKVSIRTADTVGAVAALRSGTTVILAAAKNPDALTKLIGGGVKGAGAATSVAEGAIPMYLNRFDKYGFRFYYGPGEMPSGPDGKEDVTYDTREDFNYMKAVHGGLLVWQTGQPGETSEWLTRQPAWDWCVAEAKVNGLPFGVNLGIESAADWFYNRDPASKMQFVPDFLGSYYGSMNFGIGTMVSWSSPEGQDAMLGQLQTTVRNLNDTDNITSWLEPHEELGGGVADLLVDYGPLADINFRGYLKDKYKTIQALSQRWNGDDATLTSWDQVHAPEPASFLGWNDSALDLAGLWKISFESADDPSALAPEFDDSKWGTMPGPGHGLARLLPEKPALWRRHFSVTSDWLSKHPAVWLYVWDMNDARGVEGDPSKGVVISLNGKIQKETNPYYGPDHWTALDVTKVVQEGDNFLAVRLPRGLFNYRVYLSGEEPKSYPNLGEGKNAQWVDFSSWLSHSRMMGVRRGMQMIRQVDPNRGIVLMAPDSYENDILQDAIEFGGDFHNTGYMAGWWCDREPALMRGAGLPFSTEPSQGPTLPVHIMGEMGNWISQGVNAIDHFQSLGEVLYHPDLKKTFEDHATLYTSIGRYHVPFAKVAALYSSRTNDLLGWPWNERPATSPNGQPLFRGGSYPSGFNSRGQYSPMENLPVGPSYESDAVNEGMLVRDQANKYRVIVDTDTAVMDEETLNGIERFVRQGGVFVTCGETGRHSPEKPDSWPIERLSGFHFSDDKPTNGTISLDAAQKVFASSVAFNGGMDGHRMTSSAPDATSLVNWNDGSVAAGIRPLGKGFIVTVGAWFGAQTGNTFYSGLFQWLKLDAIPAHLDGAPKIFWRHYISNNGLYDVWDFRNNNQTEASTGTLTLADGLRPAWAVDLNSGTRMAVTDGKLPVNLPPAETQLFITPRTEVAMSLSEWFTLQRGWWQGSGDLGKPLPKPNMKLSVDLTEGWAFLPLDAQADGKDSIGVMVDDSAWKQVSLGMFTLPDYPDCRHAIIRKHVHIPEAWNHGSVSLRLPGFRTGGALFIDGQRVQGEPMLKGGAGSDHVIAVEIRSNEMLMGADGPGWMTYHPDPVGKQPISGMWEPSADLMNWGAPLAVPGEIPQGTHALRAEFTIDPAAAGKTVTFHAMENSGELEGLIINGYYQVPQTREGSERNLNITPWVIPGHKNEIIVVMGGSHETITDLSLEFHVKGTYP